MNVCPPFDFCVPCVPASFLRDGSCYSTAFGFSSPELALDGYTWEGGPRGYVTGSDSETISPLGTWTPFGVVRQKQRGEKFMLGEMVGVQPTPFEPCYAVSVEGITESGIEFFDTRHQCSNILSFSHFYKLEPLTPRDVVPSPFTETVTVQTPPAPGRRDSVQSLVREFSERAFIPNRLLPVDSLLIYGYQATQEQKRQDEERFLQILAAHNTQFSDRIIRGSDREVWGGIVEKIRLPVGTRICVRADLHSDLASLIEQLLLLQRLGYLDERLMCTEGFVLLFLGDYLDRGINDIPILSLLLSLRMENPSSVYLLRGNHEDLDICSFYSRESSFLQEHHQLVNDCFESLPLSLALASNEPCRKQDQTVYQYVHFSHGLFSISDVTTLFERGGVGLSLVKKVQKFKELQRASDKATRAFSLLKTQFENVPEALDYQGYMWDDIDIICAQSPRGKGYLFSPAVVRLALHSTELRTQASGTEECNKVCACFRGHEHTFQEFEVVRKDRSAKVLVTTLPVAMSTNFYSDDMPMQELQGMLLTISSRVRDWQKVPMVVHIDEKTHKPSLHFLDASFPLYERVVAKAEEKSHADAFSEFDSEEDQKLSQSVDKSTLCEGAEAHL